MRAVYNTAMWYRTAGDRLNNDIMWRRCQSVNARADRYNLFWTFTVLQSSGRWKAHRLQLQMFVNWSLFIMLCFHELFIIIVCLRCACFKCSGVDNSIEENCRSILQEYSIQLGLDMFACLIARLLRAASGISKYTLGSICDDVRELLPGLKAWSDWMTCHVQHWNPPPLSLDPELGLVVLCLKI